MEMFQGAKELGSVEPTPFFAEPPFPLEMHEQFTTVYEPKTASVQRRRRGSEGTCMEHTLVRDTAYVPSES